MREWSFSNNERARVPVLRYVLEDKVEVVMPESNEMNVFLDAFDGNPTYTPQEEGVYTEMKTWWMWCEKELKPMIDVYKYGENLKFNPEMHILHTTELQKRIQILEDRLSENSYLVGDRLSLADIAIIPFIRQIMRTREGEFNFALYPYVRVWANNIIETDWFQNVVMKRG